MFGKNIDGSAITKETCHPWILAKKVIFVQDVLWESCSKTYFEQLSQSMFCKNIDALAIAKVHVILATEVRSQNVKHDFFFLFFSWRANSEWRMWLFFFLSILLFFFGALIANDEQGFLSFILSFFFFWRANSEWRR